MDTEVMATEVADPVSAASDDDYEDGYLDALNDAGVAKDISGAKLSCLEFAGDAVRGNGGTPDEVLPLAKLFYAWVDGDEEVA